MLPSLLLLLLLIHKPGHLNGMLIECWQATNNATHSDGYNPFKTVSCYFSLSILDQNFHNFRALKFCFMRFRYFERRILRLRNCEIFSRKLRLLPGLIKRMHRRPKNRIVLCIMLLLLLLLLLTFPRDRTWVELRQMETADLLGLYKKILARTKQSDRKKNHRRIFCRGQWEISKVTNWAKHCLLYWKYFKRIALLGTFLQGMVQLNCTHS